MTRVFDEFTAECGILFPDPNLPSLFDQGDRVKYTRTSGEVRVGTILEREKGQAIWTAIRHNQQRQIKLGNTQPLDFTQGFYRVRLDASDPEGGVRSVDAARLTRVEVS